ncbi:DMT family transporter [Paenibacillus rigui]|uniref:QacE family quaternary ammonium compound efflux SMR transporter n=1 Tax=Paenibacillus rigui TaxID=554312 RepID=A0A229UN98_9BACL|nr:multidrug efflux SMR transporter [Paenibacillus rigui]OXM84851.1 QacE family quaternary ammonium compound efflux SMR transporter [Paenibacillus rigui]
MSWVFLIFAGLMEVVSVIFIKKSDGFTRWKPTLVCLCAMGLSLYSLSMALKHIPIGTAYSIWTGIGAAGASIVGIIAFGESRDPKRIACILMIIAGVIGLKVTG